MTAAAVAEAISRTVRQFGIGGCVSLMAQEFGDHPETTRDRMRWVRQLAGEVKRPSTCSSPDAARPATGSARRAA